MTITTSRNGAKNRRTEKHFSDMTPEERSARLDRLEALAADLGGKVAELEVRILAREAAKQARR